jgi:hypothetical protein
VAGSGGRTTEVELEVRRLGAGPRAIVTSLQVDVHVVVRHSGCVRVSDRVRCVASNACHVTHPSAPRGPGASVAMAPGDLPLVELYVDEDTPPGEVEELSGVGHSLVAVRQVARLPAFTALKRLVLHGGVLTRLDGLDAVAFTLEELNLSSNGVEHLHGLGSMPKLRVLNLVRPRLPAASPFQRRRDERQAQGGVRAALHCHVSPLNCGSSKPARQSPPHSLLAHGTATQQASNRLRYLHGLQDLPRLERLVVSYNQLTSLDGVAGAPCLRSSLLSLDARANRIRGLRDCAALPSLRCLKHLWLLGNPCADATLVPHYRPALVAALPGLSSLDGEPVSEHDAAQAARLALDEGVAGEVGRPAAGWEHSLEGDAGAQSGQQLQIPPKSPPRVVGVSRLAHVQQQVHVATATAAAAAVPHPGGHPAPVLNHGVAIVSDHETRLRQVERRLRTLAASTAGAAKAATLVAATSAASAGLDAGQLAETYVREGGGADAAHAGLHHSAGMPASAGAATAGVQTDDEWVKRLEELETEAAGLRAEVARLATVPVAAAPARADSRASSDASGSTSSSVVAAAVAAAVQKERAAAMEAVLSLRARAERAAEAQAAVETTLATVRAHSGSEVTALQQALREVRCESDARRAECNQLGVRCAHAEASCEQLREQLASAQKSSAEAQQRVDRAEEQLRLQLTGALAERDDAQRKEAAAQDALSALRSTSERALSDHVAAAVAAARQEATAAVDAARAEGASAARAAARDDLAAAREAAARRVAAVENEFRTALQEADRDRRAAAATHEALRQQLARAAAGAQQLAADKAGAERLVAELTDVVRDQAAQLRLASSEREEISALRQRLTSAEKTASEAARRGAVASSSINAAAVERARRVAEEAGKRASSAETALAVATSELASARAELGARDRELAAARQTASQAAAVAAAERDASVAACDERWVARQRADVEALFAARREADRALTELEAARIDAAAARAEAAEARAQVKARDDVLTFAETEVDRVTHLFAQKEARLQRELHDALARADAASKAAAEAEQRTEQAASALAQAEQALRLGEADRQAAVAQAQARVECVEQELRVLLQEKAASQQAQQQRMDKLNDALRGLMAVS